jgi:hypothetical protein
MAANLQHSLAYLVRKRDAEVMFKWKIFLSEFLYNLLGDVMLPIVLWRHGVIGARNRSFIGRMAKAQTFVSLSASYNIDSKTCFMHAEHDAFRRHKRPVCDLVHDAWLRCSAL